MTSVPGIGLAAFVALCLLACRAQAQQGEPRRESSAALQPGDVVRLRIWREPDLSGEYLVDEDGRVTFPLLGPMDVRTDSAPSLRAKLVADYQEYLKNPSIEVVHMRRITVAGAVRNPGLYSVDPTMSVPEAIALAGGAAAGGNRRAVELIRGNTRTRIRLADAPGIGDLSLRSGDHLIVPDRSWLARNPWLVATVVSVSISRLIAVAAR